MLGYQRLEMIDEYATKVLAAPLVENPGQKIAVFLRVNRPIGNHRVGMIRASLWAAEQRQCG